MVSLTRRQMIIAGLAAPLMQHMPAVSFAGAGEQEKPEKLVLSGRILRADGNPLAGAVFSVGEHPVVTDADGRFVVVADARASDSLRAGARRDSDGTWRATLGLTLPAA